MGVPGIHTRRAEGNVDAGRGICYLGEIDTVNAKEMRRRSFFGLLSGLIAAPFLIRAKKPDVVWSPFNTKVLRDRLKFLENHPIKNPLVADGTLMIVAGFVAILSEKHAVRVGDFVITNTGDEFYCFRAGKFIDEHGTYVSDNWIHCRPLYEKKICGRRVIKIAGKYVQLKTSDRRWKIQFMPGGSTYPEGGVFHG